MRLLKWLVPALLVAGGGGYAAYHFYYRTTPPDTRPTTEAARPRLSVPVPEVRFTDVTGPAGIKFRHENGSTANKFLPETMGGGVAVLDFDRDGRQDLFFVNSCPWPGHPGRGASATSQLYRNRGDGTFEDVTERVGLNVPMYGMGVAVGDYDNDGFPDVFVSCVGKHRLFHNDGGKRFTDVTAPAAVGGPGDWPKCSKEEFTKWEPRLPFGSSATFVDYDGDGRLDLFVCQYVAWSPQIDQNISATLRGGSRAFAKPTEYEGSACLLYRNVDGRRFEDVTESAGVAVTLPLGNSQKRPLAKALGVVVCDPDEDGWPDLIVANDTVRNFFFHNAPGPNGGRVFQEQADLCNISYADLGVARGGMGIDWGEYRPGMRAAVIANFAKEPSTFLRQSAPKSLRFSDAALSVGISGPSRELLKFGAFFFDYDLDGRLDLLTANGHIEPDIASIEAGQKFEQPAQLFWNTGDERPVYEPVPADRAGPDLFKPLVGRGSAYLDFDGDGDPDVVVVGNGGPALLLRNDNKLGNRWVRLHLEGDGVRVNRSALGAELTIEAGGQVYRRSVAGARGYLSQSEFPVTVGLGATAKVDKVTVRWPGKDAGPPQVWTNLDAGKTHVLKYGDPQAH